MKKILLSILLIAACTLAVTAQKGRVYVVQDFSSITYSLPAQLEVAMGTNYEVKASGTQEDIDNIVIERDGANLLIRGRSGRHRFGSDTKIRVVMPTLSALALTGSGNITVDGTVKTSSLDVSVTGSGDVKLATIESTRMLVNISGSGSVEVLKESKVEVANYKIAGSGNIYADNVKAAIVEANIAGSGNIRAYAIDELKAKIAGSGNIDCLGSPQIVEKLKFGSGNISVK